MNGLALLLLSLLVFQPCFSANIKFFSKNINKQIQSIDPRIINGHPANPGQFPYQAALFFEDLLNSFWFCSGTIISNNWILTAAHCANEAKLVFVYTGIIDISEDIQPVDITSDFIVHEEFVPQTLANDVALVKLTKPLVYNTLVREIDLSPQPIEDGTNITISGWGQTTSNDTAISALLHYVTLRTISNDECQKEYGNTGIILPGMVCAATNPSPMQTPCHGDSGGPVIVNFGIDPHHVAIASFVSDEGCDSGRPSGYTRTASYLDWIKKKTGI